MFNDYYGFTAMLDKGSVSRSTLYRMIKAGKVKYYQVGAFKLYLLKDVINNKPRKK